jgi:hypothetical protein
MTFRQAVNTIMGVHLLMDLWKLALVAPQAAGLTLLVAGSAQWVRYVYDMWQEKLLVCGKLSVASHVNLNVSQYCLTKYETP